MLTVKASLKPSSIHGIGLFADEQITKGTMIWKFDPVFDVLFDQQQVQKMSAEHQRFIKRYAPLSPTSGKHVYSIDDSRFANHSMTGNTDIVLLPGEPEKVAIANQNIEQGEEILMNYRDFDVNSENSKAEYLNT